MSRLGLPRVHHRTTDSTNARAKALAGAGAPHGTLVTADEQTAGRGRQGRRWDARPASGVLMSVILREFEERHTLLPLTVAVAVCEAAESCAPVRCAIKWPNDVWIDGRKLAGILVEVRPHERWAVVGVGVNVTSARDDFAPELRDAATSLAIESPAAPPSREAVLAALLTTLSARLEDDAGAILEEWRRRDALRGRRVAWNGGEGTAAGIDETGALVVETGGGRVALGAGEVHLKRSGTHG